jgi:hypothetical protein
MFGIKQGQERQVRADGQIMRPIDTRTGVRILIATLMPIEAIISSGPA